MKKTLLLLTFLCIAALHSFAQADNDNFKISGGVDFGAAIGPASRTYIATSGISFKLEAPVSETPLKLIVTAGYTGYITKGGYSTGYNYNSNYGSDSYTYGHIASFIPLEAGARAYIGDKFFVEGDVGASFRVSDTFYDDGSSGTNASYNAKKVALIYAPIVGISIPVRSNSIDISLRYESRVDSQGSFNQIAVRAAFSLGL